MFVVNYLQVIMLLVHLYLTCIFTNDRKQWSLHAMNATLEDWADIPKHATRATAPSKIRADTPKHAIREATPSNIWADIPKHDKTNYNQQTKQPMNNMF